MARGSSRPQRWAQAVAKARAALDGAQAIIDDANQRIEALADEKKGELETAIQAIQQEVQDKIDSQAVADALAELDSVKEEYAEWYNNMPENLQQGPTGEKLQEIENLDTSTELSIDTSCEVNVEWSIENNLDDIISVVDEAEGMELPRGFGRD